MNMRLMSLPAALLTGLFCNVLAMAAPPSPAPNAATTPCSSSVGLVSNLMRATVENLQGKKVGQIKDILLDPSTGQANFVVLDAEIAGSGHAMLVVPYQALEMSTKPKANAPEILLDLRSDRMPTAPRILNTQSQALQNPQFLADARNYYLPQTYTVARPIENANVPPTYSPATNTESEWTRDLIDFYNE